MANLLSSKVHGLISLNNQGVYFVATEQFEEAIAIFAEALSVVKRDLVPFDRSLSDGEESPMTEIVSTSNADFSVCRRPSCEANNNMSETKVLVADPGNIATCRESAIYRTAIKILELDLDEQTFSVGNISFAVLFNLALSFHLSSIQQNMSPSRLNKALALYELAYVLQAQAQQRQPLVYCMAVLNNLGHIHEFMQRATHAQQCYERLLTAIMLITTSGQGSMLDHADSFFLNILHRLVLKKSFTSPAA